MRESRLHARFPRLVAWLREHSRPAPRVHLVPEVPPFVLPAGDDLAGAPLGWAPPIDAEVWRAAL